MVDLHTHSQASDGSLTPSELVKKAADIGLTAIALTDHDTVSGLEEFISQGKKLGLTTVSGVELSIDSKLPEKGHLHMLGLFIDMRSAHLTSTLEFLVHERKRRAEKIINILNKLGIPITLDELHTLVGESTIGRPHIAQLLIKYNLVSSIQEAFDKYLGEGQPAYVPKVKLSEEDAIALIHRAGGIAILAHPHFMNFQRWEDLKAKILELSNLGLDGVEVFYPGMPQELQEKLTQLASEIGLVISGGTDFHGASKPETKLGFGTSDHFEVPDEVFYQLRDFHQQQIQKRQ